MKTAPRSENSKTTIVRHLASPKTFSAYQVTSLALELSRGVNGEIDVEKFKANLAVAFHALVESQKQIDALCPQPQIED